MARGKKTKEKRRRGRGFTTEQFLGHVEKHASGNSGLFLNLKKANKLIRFIHPVIGILPRKIRASAIPTRIERTATSRSRTAGSTRRIRLTTTRSPG